MSILSEFFRGGKVQETEQERKGGKSIEKNDNGMGLPRVLIKNEPRGCTCSVSP
jgi:hypothetical protein